MVNQNPGDDEAMVPPPRPDQGNFASAEVDMSAWNIDPMDTITSGAGQMGGQAQQNGFYGSYGFQPYAQDEAGTSSHPFAYPGSPAYQHLLDGPSHHNGSDYHGSESQPQFSGDVVQDVEHSSQVGHPSGASEMSISDLAVNIVGFLKDQIQRFGLGEHKSRSEQLDPNDYLGHFELSRDFFIFLSTSESARIAQLTRENSVLVNNNEALCEQKENLGYEIDDLVEKVTKLEGLLGVAQNALHAERKERAEEVSGLETEISELQSELQDKKNQQRELESEYDDLEEEFSLAEQQRDEYEEKYEEELQTSIDFRARHLNCENALPGEKDELKRKIQEFNKSDESDDEADGDEADESDDEADGDEADESDDEADGDEANADKADVNKADVNKADVNKADVNEVDGDGDERMADELSEDQSSKEQTSNEHMDVVPSEDESPLKVENARLIAEVQRLNDDHRSCRSNLESARTETNSVRADRSRIQAELVKCEDNLKRAQGEKQELSTKIAKHEQDAATAQTTLTEHQGCAGRIQQLSSEIQGYQGEILTLRNAATTAAGQHSEVIGQLQAQHQGALNRHAGAIQQLQAEKQAAINAHVSCGQRDQIAEQCYSELTELRGRHANCETSITSLTSQLQQAQADHARCSNINIGLEQYQQLSNAYNGLVNMHNGCDETIAGLRNANQQAQQALVAHSNCAADRFTLEGNVQQLRNALAESTNAHASCATDKSTLEGNVQQLQNALAQSTAAHANCATDKSTLEGNVEQLQSALAESTTADAGQQPIDAHASCDETQSLLEQEIEKLRNDVAEAQQQHENCAEVKAELEGDNEKLQAEYDNCEEIIKKLGDEKQEAVDALAKCQAEKDALDTQKLAAESEHADCAKNVETTTVPEAQTKGSQKFSLRDSLRDKLKAHLEQNDQDVMAAALEAISEKQSLQSRIRKLEDQNASQVDSYNQIAVKYLVLQNSLKSQKGLESQIETLEGKQERYDDLVKDFEGQVARLESQNTALAEAVAAASRAAVPPVSLPRATLSKSAIQVIIDDEPVVVDEEPEELEFFDAEPGLMEQAEQSEISTEEEPEPAQEPADVSVGAASCSWWDLFWGFLICLVVPLLFFGPALLRFCFPPQPYNSLQIGMVPHRQLVANRAEMSVVELPTTQSSSDFASDLNDAALDDLVYILFGSFPEPEPAPTSPVMRLPPAASCLPSEQPIPSAVSVSPTWVSMDNAQRVYLLAAPTVGLWWAWHLLGARLQQILLRW